MGRTRLSVGTDLRVAMRLAIEQCAANDVPELCRQAELLGSLARLTPLPISDTRLSTPRVLYVTEQRRGKGADTLVNASRIPDHQPGCLD
jgi:hypothetical protein